MVFQLVLFVQRKIQVVRPSSVLDSQYATIFVNSAAARAYIEDAKVGIAQGHFNIGSVRETPLPLPALEEQREIVSRVHSLFALADTIEKRLTVAAFRAEALPQAILAKAFSGQLVPTEAELARAEGRDYESADVLLDRIKKERANRIAPTRSRRVESTKGRRGNRPAT